MRCTIVAMRDDPGEQLRFAEIERSLNEARLDDAQRLLAALPDDPEVESARVYFATRLLFERGRLDRNGVVERLRELLRKTPDFPEAERLLRIAEGGALEQEEERVRRVLTPHLGSPTDQADPPSSTSPLSESLRAIPRAPLVPRFGKAERPPSYVPPEPPSSETPPIPSSSFGAPISSAPPTEPFSTIPSPEPPPPSSLSGDGGTEARLQVLFGDAETELVNARPERAIQHFERASRDQLVSLAQHGESNDWSRLADAGARLFSELPVFCHFAPYDSSLFSVERLSAALDVLFGGTTKTTAPEAPGVLLVAAYLGESVRQAFGGEWLGAPSEPRTATVQALGLTLHPCERVAHALRSGTPLSVERPAHLHPGADPLGHSAPLSLAPPAPWDPEPWPSLQRLSLLGRLLPSSVVGLYCARHAARLDHSLASIEALDRYVSLLAPLDAPPALDAPWVRRAAIVVGAYLGEVLARTRGGHWQELDRDAGAQGFTLAFPDGTTTQPIAHAIERLSGRQATSLTEYTRSLVPSLPELP